MIQMVETIEQVTSIIAEKNECIKALLTENKSINALVFAKEELIGQTQIQASNSNQNLQQEISKLRSDLHIKKNGN